MSFLNKAAQFGEDFASRLPSSAAGKVLSPITLFNKEQMGKLSRMVDDQGFTHVVGKIGDDYFKGRTISQFTDSGMEYAKSTAQEASRLASQRKMVVGGLAGLVALNALGINPGGVTDKMTDLAKLGGHYTVGKTLMDMGGKARLGGIGYLGLTAYNTMFNEGDSIGPM